jgi:hypothetical protein
VSTCLQSSCNGNGDCIRVHCIYAGSHQVSHHSHRNDIGVPFQGIGFTVSSHVEYQTGSEYFLKRRKILWFFFCRLRLLTFIKESLKNSLRKSDTPKLNVSKSVFWKQRRGVAGTIRLTLQWPALCRGVIEAGTPNLLWDLFSFWCTWKNPDLTAAV